MDEREEGRRGEGVREESVWDTHPHTHTHWPLADRRRVARKGKGHIGQ